MSVKEGVGVLVEVVSNIASCACPSPCSHVLAAHDYMCALLWCVHTPSPQPLPPDTHTRLLLCSAANQWTRRGLFTHGR